MIEHRQGIRRRTLSLVEIQRREGGSVGLMYDISAHGMFVLSNAVPAIHECIYIYLMPLQNGGRPVRITGLVVHRGSHGFGVMFHELDGNAREVIRDYIGHYINSDI